MDESTFQSPPPNWQLPLSLLGFGLAIFLFAQIWGAGAESQGIDLQTTALSETKTRLETAIKRNKDELEERRPLVQASEKIQQQFQEDTDKVKKLSTTAAQFDALHKQIIDMNKLLEDRKPQVVQSENLQNQFAELIKAVDQLSQSGDKDATDILKQAKAQLGLQLNANSNAAPPAKPEDKKADAPKPAETPKPKTP